MTIKSGTTGTTNHGSSRKAAFVTVSFNGRPLVSGTDDNDNDDKKKHNKSFSKLAVVDDDESNLQHTVDEELSFLEYSRGLASQRQQRQDQHPYKDTYTVNNNKDKKEQEDKKKFRCRCCSLLLLALILLLAVALTVGIILARSKNKSMPENTSSGDESAAIAQTEDPEHKPDLGNPSEESTNHTTATTTVSSSGSSRPQVVASSETGAILQLGDPILVTAEQQQQQSQAFASSSVALSADGTRIIVLRDNLQMGQVWEWMDDGHDVVTDKERWSWHMLGQTIPLSTQQQQQSSVVMAGNGNRIGIGMDNHHLKILDWNSDSQQWIQQQQQERGSLLAGSSKLAMSRDGTRMVTIVRGNENNQVVARAYASDSDDEWIQVGNDIILLDAAETTTAEAEDIAVAMSSTGNRIVISGSREGILSLDWDDFIQDWFPVGSPIPEQNAVSVALAGDNGNLLVLGIPSDGTVRVYEWTMTEMFSNSIPWSQIGSALHGGDHFGANVAASNSRIVVSASGYAQVWEWSHSKADWEQVAKNVPDNNNHDDYGASVAIAADGNRFAVTKGDNTRVLAIIT
ncbi:expressed unknown protein [Seminavis robusta]|uniref:Uncharacterized protein n=1 Tax=Seminavis robusta TaxID=568900 RepID=A0A9N8HR08_9STRA|nr:expressed unknown protein [Seminavis robusta]|eukprot:Sro1033_g233730.1 n/a (572) ;mRNA; r:25824-27539